MGYVCVRQHDQSDCGAAVLATVALHYGKRIGLQEMRTLAGTDKVGTSLLGLAEAAERLGFFSQGVKGPYEGLSEVPLPAVAHVITEDRLGHFVVIHKATATEVVVADPAKGVETLSREQFEAQWTSALLLLTPEETFFTQRERESGLTPWRQFLRLLRPHTRYLGQAFVAAFLLTVLGLANSFFIQHLVDGVLTQGNVSVLNALSLGMVLLVVFTTALGALRHYYLIYVSRKVDLTLMSRYMRHVLIQPLLFFETRQVGEIMSRVSDASKVRQAISGTTLSALVDATMVGISMIAMLLYDVPLALAAIACVPIYVGAIALHHGPVKRRSRQAMEDGARYQASLVEALGGVETIKAFGAERRRADDADDKLVRMIQSGFSIQLLSMSMSALGGLVTGVAGIGVLWYGGHRVIEGHLTIGELMFFNSLLAYMLQPLGRLATVNLSFQDALVAVERLTEILDLEPEQLREEGKAEFGGVSRELVLEGVQFRYGSRAEILKGVDLVIPAGKTVAIVGESGSGKSTLLKLLTRFHDPTDGRIKVDGVDFRDFTLSSLRERIGVVNQEPFLFSGTLAENVAFGRPDATREQVVAAVAAAGLGDFVEALPQRYETMLGERGANLSGGQRQRLSIARALLRDPPVLILDEATSHLDTQTERVIQSSLTETFQDKTVVVVAHRLSTIREADLIYVLADGKVAEAGTHQELLDARGTYADYWWAQVEEGGKWFPQLTEHSAEARELAQDTWVLIEDDDPVDMLGIVEELKKRGTPAVEYKPPQ